MAALVQVKTLVPAAIISDISRELARKNLSARQLGTWLIIDFSDGCDSFFARIQCTSVEEPPEVIAARIAKEYERVDQIRSAVLKGVRWLAVENQIALQVSSSGVWGIQSFGTSSLYVGPRLTRIAQASASAAEALIEFRKNHWLPEVTVEKAEELV